MATSDKHAVDLTCSVISVIGGGQSFSSSAGKLSKTNIMFGLLHFLIERASLCLGPGALIMLVRSFSER